MQSALILAYNEMIDYKGKMEEFLERHEVQCCEYRNKAVEALRVQREESRKAYAVARASYEERNFAHERVSPA
eukprot:10585918-Heterocapsa_arctica.AAC.1